MVRNRTTSKSNACKGAVAIKLQVYCSAIHFVSCPFLYRVCTIAADISAQGASAGAGMGNAFLSQIRGVQAWNQKI